MHPVYRVAFDFIRIQKIAVLKRGTIRIDFTPMFDWASDHEFLHLVMPKTYRLTSISTREEHRDPDIQISSTLTTWIW